MSSREASPLPTESGTGSDTGASTPLSLNAHEQPSQAKICVFCGSAPGHDPIHLETARALARVMAANHMALVYGGGTIGLMGEMARTLVALSGPDAVHGIIPEALVRYERDAVYTSMDKGGAMTAVPEEKVFGRTTIVKDMHTRKQMMTQEVLAGGPGSGFIALSGGYGTVEELLETATWNQLGIHDKGICVLNVNGFYDGIFDWIKKSVAEGFIRGGNDTIVAHATTADEAIRALREYRVSPSVLKLAWGNLS